MFTTVTLSVLSILLLILTIITLMTVVYYTTQYKTVVKFSQQVMYMDDIVTTITKRLTTSIVVFTLSLIGAIISIV